MQEDLPLEDHALIGNSRTAALISREGSVDWLCWPRFDSAAVLCRLLDRVQGGFLSVTPRGPFTVARRYLPDTNVLELVFETSSGAVRAVWFMPVSGDEDSHEGHAAHWLALRLEGVRGSMELEVTFKPTFDLARARTEVVPVDGGAVATAQMANPAALSLLTHARLCRSGPAEVSGSITMTAGERRFLLLAAGAEATPGPLAVAPDRLERALEQTVRVWRSWTEKVTYAGLYPDLVRRSALVLKLLTHAPTGAVVAAPTTSLPEHVGGVRNWDYRFAWLRDSAWVVYALQRLGHHDEAMSLWRWLEELTARDDDLQVMYAANGTPAFPEQHLEHLHGYRGSRPVRVGNGASAQRQLDVYGEVLDSAEFCQREMGGMDDAPFWNLVSRLAAKAEALWRQPDQGIWELRREPQHFVHSKVMCWVALDRAAKLAQRLGRPEACAAWQREAARIHAHVIANGLHPRHGWFTQAYGSAHLDATALVLPLVGFLPATDPRVRVTADRIEEELSENGFVRRYRNDDGLAGREGAFLLCTFWMADVRALQGRVAEARALFERAAGAANDVGLLAEQVDPQSGALLGNFPQGFSHLGLIRSALLLTQATERGEGRPAPGHAPS